MRDPVGVVPSANPVQDRFQLVRMTEHIQQRHVPARRGPRDGAGLAGSRLEQTDWLPHAIRYVDECASVLGGPGGPTDPQQSQAGTQR